MTPPGLVELVVAAEEAATAEARRDAVAAAAIDDVTAALHRSADTSHLVAFVCGHRSLAGGGGGPVCAQRRRRARRDRPGRGSGAGAARDDAEDEPGMRRSVGDRHRPGRAGEPRGDLRPGLGPARGVRCRGARGSATAGRGRRGPGRRGRARHRRRSRAGVRSAAIVAITGAAPPPELVILLGWADEVRGGRPAVRANADTGDDARRARELGAEGIGLCRTEHMFLGEPAGIVARLLAIDDDERVARSTSCSKSSGSDFVEVLDAMDGLPVTVRLLDAPLHEFLAGSSEAERAAWASRTRCSASAACAWRSCAAGLYRTQVGRCSKRWPLAGSRRRPASSRSWCRWSRAPRSCRPCGPWIDEEIARSVLAEPLVVGTMIETPRAALVAADLAEHADFFSFGTNDLTQMMFGFSRDDIESSVIGAYLQAGAVAAPTRSRRSTPTVSGR